MTTENKLAEAQLNKLNRKAKKRRDALTVFSAIIPVVFFGMHWSLGLGTLIIPFLVWKHLNKEIV